MVSVNGMLVPYGKPMIGLRVSDGQVMPNWRDLASDVAVDISGLSFYMDSFSEIPLIMTMSTLL